jgi:hypothetical protein
VSWPAHRRFLITLAGKGYIGAGEPVLTPYRDRNKRASQRAATRWPRSTRISAFFDAWLRLSSSASQPKTRTIIG